MPESTRRAPTARAARRDARALRRANTKRDRLAAKVAANEAERAALIARLVAYTDSLYATTV